MSLEEKAKTISEWIKEGAKITDFNSKDYRIFFHEQQLIRLIDAQKEIDKREEALRMHQRQWNEHLAKISVLEARLEQARQLVEKLREPDIFNKKYWQAERGLDNATVHIFNPALYEIDHDKWKDELLAVLEDREKEVFESERPSILE